MHGNLKRAYYYLRLRNSLLEAHPASTPLCRQLCGPWIFRHSLRSAKMLGVKSGAYHVTAHKRGAGTGAPAAGA